MPELTPIKVVLMRGGTSKGVFINEIDLPQDPGLRERVILAVMGSPDPRQIDGLGGADPLTSKVCIIGPGRHHDADVSYTFGQVGIDDPYVALSGNCGNLSAAVGVYAIEAGYVAADGPETAVRIYNTNSKRILVAHVPIRDGRPAVEGTHVVAGVPGSGAEIRMDFSATAGATTGRILPTGNPRDELFIPELGRTVAVSIVDVAKATCFFHANEVGITGTEGPDAFTPELLDRFWAIRKAAAIASGLGPDSRPPAPAAVSPAQAYTDYMSGQTIPAAAMSFAARRVIGPPPRLHKAFASTGAVCTAVAANIPGTIVNEVSADVSDGLVRIGHPTGVFPVRIRLDGDGNLVEASYSRTARRLLEGFAYVRSSLLDGLA